MKIIINETGYKNLVKMLNEEIFYYNDLSDEEKDKLFQIFKLSYEKSTGTSWDRYKFDGRARNWKFFGIKDGGFIVVRKQQSGLNKVTGVAGDVKSIMLGINELNGLNEPVWGMADKKLVDMMVKKYGYHTPPAFVVKIMIKYIPKNVFGDVDFVVNSDGGITFKYTDVGDATKYMFGNKLYFKSVFPMISSKLVGIPRIIKMGVEKFFNLFS